MLLEELKSVKTHTPSYIAKHHSVPLKDIMRELKRGIEVEQEHSKDKDTAREIALDHLLEIPDYYTRLDKMEATAKAETKGKKA
jgi:hypothetical protein